MPDDDKGAEIEFTGKVTDLADGVAKVNIIARHGGNTVLGKAIARPARLTEPVGLGAAFRHRSGIIVRGCLPTSPNLHEVAQEVAAESRIVYVETIPSS